MGLFFSKPPEEHSYQGPALRTPLSDLSGPVGHWDLGPCLSFEMNYLDCMEAYGQIKGKKSCSLYWQDFIECTQSRKQLHKDREPVTVTGAQLACKTLVKSDDYYLLRVKEMRDERDKQWVKGLVGAGPRVPLFATPPPMDSYSPDPVDNPE